MRIAYPINIELGKSGGVETYAINLISSLQDIDAENAYILFCTVLNAEAFPLKSANFKKIVSGKFRVFESAKRRAMPAFDFMESKTGLRAIKRAAENILLEGKKVFGGNPSCDLIHYMFTVFPYWRKFDAPVVLTIVDIQQEYLPEFFAKGELGARSRHYRSSAERADHIIAISSYTKRTLIDKYAIPEDKITVVHLGYDAKAYMKLDGKIVEEFRKEYGLPERFLLYPAAFWPHKNHLNLVRAFRVLKDKYGYDGKLVLTGIKKGGHGVFEKEVNALGLDGEIICLGYLAYDELPLLYNAASCLVFPSLFEGFGIPLVEAFATGLPVACSNITSLPEVGGDAAVYFDPEQPQDMAEKINRVCSDKGFRENLIEKGFERSRLFSWDNTAQQTLKVYEKVYSKTRTIRA